MELLVVMAIVVLLSSLLLPSLQKARGRAKHARWLGFRRSIRTDPDGILYYTFEEGEGSTVKNLAVGPYGDATYAPEKFPGTVNGLTWVTDGGRWPGKTTLYFDGVLSHYIRFPYREWMKEILQREATMACWVKLNNCATTNHVYLLMPTDTGPNRIVMYIDQDLPGRLTFSYHTTSGPGGTPYTRYVYVDGVIETGKWYHIVATWYPTGAKVYVNGEEEGDGIYAPDDILINESYFYIGGEQGSSRILNGYMDEVAIYRRALTAEEVKELYKGGKP